MKTKKRSLSARTPPSSNTLHKNKDICSYSTLDFSTGFSIPINKSSKKTNIPKHNTTIDIQKIGKKHQYLLGINSSKKLNNFIDYTNRDISINQTIIGKANKQKCHDLNLTQKNNKKSNKDKTNNSQVKNKSHKKQSSLINRTSVIKESKTSRQDIQFNNLTKQNSQLQQNLVSAFQKHHSVIVEHQRQIEKLRLESLQGMNKKQQEILQLSDKIKTIERQGNELKNQHQKYQKQLTTLKRNKDQSQKTLKQAKANLQRQIRTITGQYKNKQQEYMRLLLQNKSNQYKLTESAKKLNNSEQRNEELLKTVDQLNGEINKMKGNMDKLLNENKQLTDKINKSHKEKCYIQDNLYEVLGNIRDSMAGYKQLGQQEQSKENTTQH